MILLKKIKKHIFCFVFSQHFSFFTAQKKMEHTDDADKFSSLDCNVLVEIISRLPFKEAVRNSLLSKNWRFLWLATSNVEFDETFFVKNGEIDKGNQRRAFLDYFNRWIENYNGTGVEKFRLVFSHPEDHLQEMDKFIRFAIRGELKMLDLDFSDPLWNEESVEIYKTFVQMPWYKGHEKLEFLKLYSCNLPVVSRFNTFSALKHIYLGWIGLDPDTIRDLLLKCPVLEVLSFKECWNFEGNFEVTSPNLRNLIMDNCDPPSPGTTITVNAPRLRSFKYSGEVITDLKFRGMDELEEAELDFGREPEYVEELGDMLADMLLEIPPVRTLTVCSFMLQLICDGEEPVLLKPPLDSVRHLILKTALNRKEFYGITFFLNSCPHLQLLTIDLVPARIFDAEPVFPITDHVFVNNYPSMIISYRCVRKTLSTIVVNGFRGDPDEIIALGYFLRYGGVLHTMHIRIPRGGAENEANYMEKVGRLLQFRGSSSLPNVVVQFLEPDSS